MKKNNYAFIDSQNLNLGILDQGWKLDFKKFRVYLGDKYEVSKGNVDAELVLHAMIEYDNYDKAVIVTGDGDFHCLVEYLNNKNKLLRLLVPNQKKYSSLLRPFAPNKIAYIDDLRKKLELIKKRGNS